MPEGFSPTEVPIGERDSSLRSATFRMTLWGRYIQNDTGAIPEPSLPGRLLYLPVTPPLRRHNPSKVGARRKVPRRNQHVFPLNPCHHSQPRLPRLLRVHVGPRTPLRPHHLHHALNQVPPQPRPAAPATQSPRSGVPAYARASAACQPRPLSRAHPPPGPLPPTAPGARRTPPRRGPWAQRRPVESISQSALGAR